MVTAGVFAGVAVRTGVSALAGSGAGGVSAGIGVDGAIGSAGLTTMGLRQKVALAVMLHQGQHANAEQGADREGGNHKTDAHTLRLRGS